MRPVGISRRGTASRAALLAVALVAFVILAAIGWASPRAAASVEADVAAHPPGVSTTAAVTHATTAIATVRSTTAVRIPRPLRLAATGRLSLGWVPVRAVAVSCSPRTIRVGIPCGMSMCGRNPCLCGGPVDRWGNCACNGLRTVAPTFSVRSADNGIVRVLSIGRRHWLLPTGVGHTVVTVRGSLIHYDSAVAAVVITVTPAAFVALGLGAVVLIVAMGAAAAAVVIAVRRLHIRRREGTS